MTATLPATNTGPVLAAGALCWRMVQGTARVLVIHRGDRSDISLPKGKVDPGETLPQTAVREIAEETGLSICLGAPLGAVTYMLPSGRQKVVQYWSAEIDDHALELSRFIPNAEVASLEWLPMDKARKKLTYEHDRAIVDRFEKRLKKGQARTFALVVVRHGKAVPPETWDGPDSTRPLLQRGVDQSGGIARGMAAFGPGKIFSSPAARCLATVEPLAALTGLPVKPVEDISQDSYTGRAAGVAAVVAKRIRKGVTSVLCSHGPVIPQILEEAMRLTRSNADATLRQAAGMSTGQFAVLHIPVSRPKSGIVAAELHSPPQEQ